MPRVYGSGHSFFHGFSSRARLERDPIDRSAARNFQNHHVAKPGLKMKDKIITTAFLRAGVCISSSAI